MDLKKESMYQSELVETKEIKAERVEILLRQIESTLARESTESKELGPAVAYSKLYTFANGSEKAIMFIGWIFAGITGLGMPSFAFIFGDILNAFDPQEDTLDLMKRIGLIMTCIGVGIWVLSYVYYAALLVTSEKIVRKTRTEYVKAILR